MAPMSARPAALFLGALVLNILTIVTAYDASGGSEASNNRKVLTPDDVRKAIPVGSSRFKRAKAKNDARSASDPALNMAPASPAINTSPDWWPFTATCVSSATVRDNQSGKETICPTGTACQCPRFIASDESWNCIENDVPCRNIPHSTPRYPIDTFQATIAGGLYDGSSVTNLTGQWVHDGANQRERLDTVVWERSAPPNHFFSLHSARQVTAQGMTYETVSDSANMREARCDGAPSEVPFSGSAAVGSLNRFLPRDARLFPGGRDDKFLGYEDVDVPGGRRRASVWGWFEHENSGASSSSSNHMEVGYHKVYVSVRTGWPVREEQALYGEGGESSGVFVTAFVEFTFDHAQLSSETRGSAATAVTESRFLGVPEVESSVFALPDSCSVVRATMHSAASGGEL